MEPDAATRFDRIVAGHLAEPDVTAGTGFGSSAGLRVGGRIFAMLSGDRLVVKLPRPRVDEIVEAGSAVHFDPGHGRLMREWADVDGSADWETLVAEALAFVRRQTKGAPRGRS